MYRNIYIDVLNTNFVCYSSYTKMFAQLENKLILSDLAVFRTGLTNVEKGKYCTFISNIVLKLLHDQKYNFDLDNIFF